MHHGLTEVLRMECPIAPGSTRVARKPEPEQCVDHDVFIWICPLQFRSGFIFPSLVRVRAVSVFLNIWWSSVSTFPKSGMVNLPLQCCCPGVSLKRYITMMCMLLCFIKPIWGNKCKSRDLFTSEPNFNILKGFPKCGAPTHLLPVLSCLCLLCMCGLGLRLFCQKMRQGRWHCTGCRHSEGIRKYTATRENKTEFTKSRKPLGRVLSSERLLWLPFRVLHDPHSYNVSWHFQWAVLQSAVKES